jgi:hypothetical protein
MAASVASICMRVESGPGLPVTRTSGSSSKHSVSLKGFATPRFFAMINCRMRTSRRCVESVPYPVLAKENISAAEKLPCGLES